MSAGSDPMSDDGGGGGSTSTITAETETGWHVLKVERYSQTKGVLGVGNGAKSAVFAAAGHRWRVGYFPDGYTDEAADWIGLDLFLDDPSPTASVDARFVFTLLDRAGEPVPEYTAASDDLAKFSAAVPSWGFERFIERAALESSPHLADDGFRVRCDVTVVKSIGVKVPTSDSDDDDDEPRSSWVATDVVFEVGAGGEMIEAHRHVLASASPVFKAELSGPLKLGWNGLATKRIDDMEPRAFMALLHFIYTGAFPEQVVGEGGGSAAEVTQQLLVAADRYGIRKLKLMCEGRLICSVDASTVVSNLELAEKHGCSRLREACFDFLDI